MVKVGFTNSKLHESTLRNRAAKWLRVNSVLFHHHQADLHMVLVSHNLLCTMRHT